MAPRHAALVMSIILASTSCATAPPEAHETNEAPVAEVAAPEAPLSVGGLDVLDDEAVAVLFEKEDATFVYIHSKGCAACPPTKKALETYLLSRNGAPRFAVLDMDGESISPRALMDALGFMVAFPTVFFIEHGRVLDAHVGGSIMEERFIEDFIARNTPGSERAKLEDFTSVTRAGQRVRAKSSRVSNVNMSGADLSEMVLLQTAFTGSDLSGVSFDRAQLSGVLMSRADLRGATFSGATLRKVFWGACICPDGTRSEDHGYTCVGHLGTDDVVIEDAFPRPPMPSNDVKAHWASLGIEEGSVEYGLVFTAFSLTAFTKGYAFEPLRELTREDVARLIEEHKSTQGEDRHHVIDGHVERLLSGERRFFYFETKDPKPEDSPGVLLGAWKEGDDAEKRSKSSIYELEPRRIAGDGSVMF